MRGTAAHLCVALALTTTVGCSRPSTDYTTSAQDPELLHGAVQQVTETMVESVTSPPVASRTYAYASIAAYEALRHDFPEYPSLAGQLNGLRDVPQPETGKEHLLPLASVYAFLTVAEALVFEPAPVAAHRDSLVLQLKQQGVPKDVLQRSVAYGEEVARHVLAWAAADNLKMARAMPRFEVRREPGRWQPTPPAYMQGVEPNWGIMRPFVMDSASQFRPPPPLPYDLREGSGFHRQLMEVYQAGMKLTEEQREIAAFWDCNPYALQTEGHVMFAVKKISPGGHWMGIAGLASRQTGADLMRTAEVYTRVAVALADGFISAWEEKYRSVLVRPETLINEAIDPNWRPVLQTPPFPEYPSGHSVISAAVAEVLTDLFGDNFAFDDDVEVPYGLPVRSFPSFRQAAEEAAISRLYGGIHYPMAIENGLEQGRDLGRHVVARLGARQPLLANR